MEFQMTAIDQGVLILYLLIMIGIGVYSVKFASKSREAFYVAERSMGSLITTWALLACIISASGMLAAAELTYVFGWSAMWPNIGNMIWVFFLISLVSIPMRRFGKLTVPDFFNDRYGKNVRFLSVIIILALYVVFMVAQTYGISSLLSSVFNVSYMGTMIVVVAVFVLYTLLGGMFAAIWTDFIQGILLWFAAFIAFFAGMLYLGMVPGDLSSLNIMLSQVNEVFVDNYGNFGWQAGLAWIIHLGFGVAALPHIVMRFYTARDEKVILRSTTWLILLVLIFFYTANIAGLVARIIVPADLRPVLALPTVLYTVLPNWLAAIGMAGIVAAIMSTVNSVLLVMSGAIVHDVYSQFKPDASEKTVVSLSRISMVVIGVIIIILAANPPQFLFQVMAFFFGLMAAAFFFPLVLGLHWPRTTNAGALAGMAGGVAINLLSLFFVNVPINTIYGVVGSLILTVGVTLATKEPSEDMQNLVRRISLFAKSD